MHDSLKSLARSITSNCFRDTGALEDIHSGIFPCSKTGDFADVKVVTPYGEIPWSKLSRISDEEMSSINHEAVNKTYTYLKFLLDHKYGDHILNYSSKWDEPEIDSNLQAVIDHLIITLEKKYVFTHYFGE